MIVDSSRVQVEGHLLHRVVFRPDGVGLRAHAVFFHGQGDYAERYSDVLHPFTKRGIAVTITELPGHGRSPGRRGHAGNTELLDAMVADTLGSWRGQPHLPYGVMGHSMGGLLAARHLLLAGAGKFPAPKFAWLSSPLIDPGQGQSAWRLKLVKCLAPLMPGLTVSTGVTPEMCRVKQDADPAGVAEPEREPFQLWHSRISLGWAAQLLGYAAMLERDKLRLPPGISLLYTQGTLDPVCPEATARRFFDRLPVEDKHYAGLDGLLHEPFRGDGSEETFSAISQWLDRPVL